MPFANVPEFPVDTSVGNDKIITVPAEETWQVRGVFCKFVTTATVGTRFLVFEYLTPAPDVAFTQDWSESQIASLTKRFAAAPQLTPSEDQAGVQLFIQIPVLWLLPGWAVRVFDVNNIDNADVLTISMNRVISSVQ